MLVGTPGLKAALAGAALALLLGVSAKAADPTPVPEIRPGILAGYLTAAELPDGVKLLSPPPALGSPAEALDLDVARQALALQGTPRFKLAATDAEIKFPATAGLFSCALGVAITDTDTPTLYRLLRRVTTDAFDATEAPKEKYMHARPYMLDGAPTCQPSEDKRLRNSGSYPSGHTTTAWSWALTLAEIAPDRAEAALERGRAFGESRLICNAHWASDVAAGRALAAATVAAMHAKPDYLADVAGARQEIAAARAKGLPPRPDCAAEAETLSQTPWLAP